VVYWTVVHCYLAFKKAGVYNDVMGSKSNAPVLPGPPPALANAKPPTAGRPSKAVIDLTLVLIARGYTVRRIIERVMQEENHIIDAETVLKIATSEENLPMIEAIRAEIAERALTQGIASKEERLTRLQELADSWESSATSGQSTKAANTYLNVLKAVRDEVEPLGLVLHLPPGDPWARLMNDLTDVAMQGKSKVNRLGSGDDDGGGNGGNK
jgi:hypothetical protein